MLVQLPGDDFNSTAFEKGSDFEKKKKYFLAI